MTTPSAFFLHLKLETIFISLGKTLVLTIKNCINDKQNENDTTIKVTNLLESEYGHWRGFDRLDTAIPDVYKKITK